MKRYRIGYAIGTYDMFHIGHLNIIKRAKENCDYLVVGVNTDELVKENKHKMPIIPFSDRMEILKSIKYVDEVIPQTSKNRLENYDKIHFDAMFVGDDWKGKPQYIELEKDLNDLGADLVYFSYTDGISSTVLREKINKDADGNDKQN